MVETITPVVHGGRKARYASTALLHVLGAGVSAAGLGVALAGLGSVLGAPWGPAGNLAVLVVAAVYALREWLKLPIPLPDRSAQVPYWWRTFFSPGVAAFLYGLGLGVGFATFLTFGTFVAVTAAALAAGDPLVGAACCAPFGIARGAAVVVAGRAERAHETVDRIEELGSTPIPRLVNAAALTAVVLAAAVAL